MHFALYTKQAGQKVHKSAFKNNSDFAALNP